MQRDLVRGTTPGGDALAGNSHTFTVEVNKGGTPDNVGVDSGSIKLGRIPKPRFGHSGNEVDRAIIEAQKAIQDGNTAAALSKVKEAIRLLREVDFNDPSADMINQTEVAKWVLEQLKAQATTDMEVLELSRQLERGVNGLELKKYPGYKPQEQRADSSVNPPTVTPALKDDDVPFDLIDSLLQNIPPTQENEFGDKLWENIASFLDPESSPKLKEEWLFIARGGPKSVAENEYRIGLTGESGFLEFRMGVRLGDYNEWQRARFTLFLSAIKMAISNPEETRRRALEKEEADRRDIAEVIPAYTQWPQTEVGRRTQKMQALESVNDGIEGIPRNAVSLQLFFDVLTRVYRILGQNENKTITTFTDISSSRYSNRILLEKGLLRDKNGESLSTAADARLAGETYIDMEGYQQMAGNEIEFLMGSVLRFVDDPQGASRIRVCVAPRYFDKAYIQNIEEYARLYEALLADRVPIEFPANFARLYLGEYNVKYLRDSAKYPLFGNSAAIPQVIPMDIADIPPQASIGEKPYKLLRMAQAGLNVPPFFAIITDGSGKIALTDNIRHAFGALRKPVIVRSAHKDEGAKYSFSGAFDSYGGITALKPTGTEILSKDQEGFWDTGFRPESLQSAYRLIVEGATEDYRVKKYLKTHQITSFNPKQMNVVVMEQIDIDVFGMFLTSTQNNPDEVLIHYQLVGKNVAGKKTEPEPDFSQSPKGGVIVYNKRTRELEKNNLDEQTRKVLQEFGEVAGQIEQMFGVQQIELGAANGEVYVFQSRDINLSKPEDSPRLAHYETLCEELRAIGYGYYHLPILVVDSLVKTHPEIRRSEEYQKLEQAYVSTPEAQLDLKRERWKELRRYIAVERNKYREELLRFTEEHPEYILVIKDAMDVLGESDHPSFLPLGEKKYSFLNQLASKAKVVIRGRNQTAIRHSDWDNVETGGITVIPPEEGGGSEFYFISIFEDARREGTRQSPFIYSTAPGHRGDNVSLQRTNTIITGDRLNVLSNIDGVFIWIGKPLIGTEPPSGGIPANDKDRGGTGTKSGLNAGISAGSQTKNPEAGKSTGGVDFRALPMVTQPFARINMPLKRLDNSISRGPEWKEIQNMVKAGIIPSCQRIKDYLQSCGRKKELNAEIAEVLNCIADILRMEEEYVLATDPEFKDLLAQIESGKSIGELSVALNKINLQPKVSK